ncbi:MAG: hypothetical protein L6Q38_17215, partial [Nitrospira sp.]|nr:hypothetical protein [Nitrospira sp.]
MKNILYPRETTTPSVPASAGPRIAPSLRALGFRGLVLAAASILLSACDVATSREPIGRQPANLADLKVEGVWKAGQEHFFVRIADAESGRLEVAQLKSEGGEFKVERTEILVRRQDDALLVNLRAVAPEARSEYVFGRAVVKDGAAILYLAGKKPIEALAKTAGIGIATRSLDEPDGDHDSVVVTNGFDR